MFGAYRETLTPNPRSSLGAACSSNLRNQVRSLPSQSYAASTMEMASVFTRVLGMQDSSPLGQATDFSASGYSHFFTSTRVLPRKQTEKRGLGSTCGE